MKVKCPYCGKEKYSQGNEFVCCHTRFVSEDFMIKNVTTE